VETIKEEKYEEIEQHEHTAEHVLSTHHARTLTLVSREHRK
jgi:hypothetical protein